MRKIAPFIAICLASYGCAASAESEPPGGSGGSGGIIAPVGGSPTSGGQSPSGAGTTSVGQGGSGGTGTVSPSGGSGLSTAGTTSTTAGTTGVGGAAPGGACTATAMATGTPPLIDDFEDGDANVMIADGRVGGWFLSTDTTGTTTPAAGAPMPVAGGMPGKAIHVSGSGLTMWGASLSASLTPLNGCYNGAAFTGVTVMLKGTGSVWVSVLTAAVRAAPEGMRNHYKKQVTLGAEWTTVTINFSELMQPGGWGTIVPFDATKIYGIDFGPATTQGMPTSFDFWVDNLSFK